MQLYSEYCNNQVSAAKLLDKLLLDNQNFYNFHDVCFFSNVLF